MYLSHFNRRSMRLPVRSPSHDHISSKEVKRYFYIQKAILYHSCYGFVDHY